MTVRVSWLSRARVPSNKQAFAAPRRVFAWANSEVATARAVGMPTNALAISSSIRVKPRALPLAAISVPQDLAPGNAPRAAALRVHRDGAERPRGSADHQQ